MKLLTVYSPSHRVLFDGFFLPSVQRYGIGMELEALVCDQHGLGDYYTAGWNRAMQDKISAIVLAMTGMDGRTILYSDVDVQWFGEIVPGIEAALTGHDLAAMRDGDAVCAGFLAIRVSPTTRDLFCAVWAALQRSAGYVGDQQILNRLLAASPVRVATLPRPAFWNLGKHWTRGEPIPGIPVGVLLQHANWVRGVEAKRTLMEHVRLSIEGARA
jgi:hypothetical protein